HVNFDELPQMASDHVSSDPTPKCQGMALEHDSLSPDHPLEQVIGNPSQSVRTRRQLESDGEMCMFALTVSRTKPKNIKEAMANSAWIESMQEELHQFDRFDVWELVDRPLCTNVIKLKWLWKKNMMKRILSFETNLVMWIKDMRKRKELILKNLSHLLLGWKL
nr:Gag-Pol polyprotein [Tanacetum cinerariifolium]